MGVGPSLDTTELGLVAATLNPHVSYRMWASVTEPVYFTQPCFRTGLEALWVTYKGTVSKVSPRWVPQCQQLALNVSIYG